MKILVVWDTNWASHHFWNWPFEQFFNYFTRVCFGKLPKKNVKNYCLAFWKYVWYGLAVGHVTIFWNWPFEQFLWILREHDLVDLLENVKKLLFGILKIFLVWGCSWACYHFWNWPSEQFFWISREHVLGDFLENVKNYCLGFWKYFLVWACNWACYHFWNWPFKQFLCISREHVLGDFFKNVKNYCLGFWKYFFGMGLQLGMIPFFNFSHPPNLLSRSHGQVKWLRW